MGSKAEIIRELERQILPLQGYRQIPANAQQQTGLGPILNAFPNNTFPTGAIHEWITQTREDAAATSGFICALAGTLMGTQGVSIWIGSNLNIYPPALVNFNVNAGNIICIDVKKEKDILCATEEALQCEALTTVIAEVPNLSFTASRRLQLAVEKSRVTGFLIRNAQKQLNTTASICRWKITSLASEMSDNLPGVGNPKWNVELLKVRNGQPGTWTVVWAQGKFQHTYAAPVLLPDQKRKTG